MCACELRLEHLTTFEVDQRGLAADVDLGKPAPVGSGNLVLRLDNDPP